MTKLLKHVFINDWELSTPASEGRKFEINVLFTDPKGTLAALKTAGTLAHGLEAAIRLLAVQAVPFALPLNQPAVPTEFTEKLLLDLVRQEAQGPIETTAHLYLCRNQLDTIGQVLAPNSLVVVGRRKAWWPNDAGWMVRMLRSAGHEVICVNAKGGTDARYRLRGNRDAILHR